MVMIKVNVFEAKARLSEYLDRAVRGERVVVCRHNKPVAELRPVSAVRSEPRPIGPLRGRPSFDVPSSFFEPMSDDDLDLWEGGPVSPSSYSATSRSPRVAGRTTDATPRKPAKSGQRSTRSSQAQSKRRRRS